MAKGGQAVAAPEMDTQHKLESLLEGEDSSAPESNIEPQPEEPQAEAEPETEAPGDDTADVDAEEQPQAEAPKTWKVKVDGAEVEVPEDELLRGYSRQQDYTRKTMKLAEERKALESEAERVRVERTQYAERLEAMKTVLDQQMGAEPNWDQLRAEDPAAYAAKYADWQRQQNAKDRLLAEQDRVNQQMAAERQAQFQAQVAAERERLLDALPEWKNTETARKEQEALIQYGKQVGFTDDELGNLYDHRAVLILEKARKWDMAQQKGHQVLKDKAVTAPVLKPGTPSQPKEKSSAYERAAKRFKATGKPQDAAALIEHLLED